MTRGFLNDGDLRAALLRVVIGREGPVVPTRASWSLWTWTARQERVVPLLFNLVDFVPTDLTDPQRDETRQLMGAVLSRCVHLEHHLVESVRLLTQSGVRSAVLKGAATAHLDYPDPSWREFGDVDVLVNPVHRVQASQLLERAGWVRGYASPPGHDEFVHALTLVHNGVELDLHQRIAHRSLGLLAPTDVLLDRAIVFEVAGVDLNALDDADRLIHAALHATASRGVYRRLSSTADLLLLTNRRPHLASKVLARAERWRVRSLVERGVTDAYAAAQLELPPEWVEAMRLPIRRRDRLVDRAYLGAARRPVVEELAYVRLLPRWGDRWRYVSGYFATDAAYTEQHGRAGLRAQIGYVVKKLRSGPP